MIKAEEIIGKLEQSRRLAFPSFEKIILQSEAVNVLVNLFLHPGCKSDVNLAKFLTGVPVKLSDISPHIITAFPTQVAKYAARKGITDITAADLLECFALDHTDAVEENQRLLGMEPSYALAHVLTVGTVQSVHQMEVRALAILQVKVCKEPVTFSHVLVPAGITVAAGQKVFHHFGVVVANVASPSLAMLAMKLQKDQDKKSFMKKTIKQVVGADVQTIDYAKASFFRVDMTGNIITESKKDMNFQKLWQEEDLKRIKFPKEAKIMFQS
ncbi:MAG: hypothetical protein WC544_04295 [Patescibacteria group bacterium]